MKKLITIILIAGLYSCKTYPTGEQIEKDYVRSTLVKREGKLHTFITDNNDTLVRKGSRKWIVGGCYMVSKK